ncbi:MAG TPA: hypothetical protein VIU29_07805 [Candidatus Deferrimicrobiaceae bacterium]
MQRRKLFLSATAVLAAAVFVVILCRCNGGDDAAVSPGSNPADQRIAANAALAVEKGRQTFRFDTFGDNVFWGGAIKLHQALAGAANGGVGPGVSPATALAVGLKIDVDALPGDLVVQLRNGQVDLASPATTLALLKLNSVVGVTGYFDTAGTLVSVGIQCALCHSTVDDSFAAPGIPAGNIGRRLDGWPNRDLNVGAIINLSPDLSAVVALFTNAGLAVTDNAVRNILLSWGPGKFDAELFMDGQSHPTLIPPAFGLAGVNLHTSSGWGSVTHWNAFVAVLEMHGQGTFFDPRLKDPARFPVAFANGFDNVRSATDLVTSKLADLHLYQLAIPAPAPPAGSFDNAAAARGQAVFNGKANCARCHVPPLFTEPGWNMHAAAEIGIDNVQALRGPDQRYRTAPLKGLWAHAKGGFFHDGRFATLDNVVTHYDTTFALGLTAPEKADLVQYLLSL